MCHPGAIRWRNPTQNEPPGSIAVRSVIRSAVTLVSDDGGAGRRAGSEVEGVAAATPTGPRDSAMRSQRTGRIDMLRLIVPCPPGSRLRPVAP